MKKFTSHLLIPLLLLSLFFRSNAQTIIPNTATDKLIYNYSDVVHVSTDILETPPVGSYLYTVTFGHANTSGGTGVVVHHPNNPAGDTMLIQMKEADVALANYMPEASGQTHYIVSMANLRRDLNTNSSPWRAYVTSLLIHRVGYTNRAIVLDAGWHDTLSTGNFATNPRIDYFADTINKINSQTPSFHRYAATWGEDDDTLHLGLADMTISDVISHYAFSIGDTVRNADVGAQFLVDSNQRIAHIGFTRDSVGRTYIYHAEINCSATTPYIKNLDLLGFESARISSLRMEAMTLYSTIKGGTRWGLVYKRANGQVVHFNSMNLTGEVLNSGMGEGISPCIAAGMGFPNPSDTTKTGNKHYTPAWIGCSGNVLRQYVDARTGTRPFSSFYYVTNDTPATTPLAIATSSNKGDRTIAAWYDGTNVWCKIFQDMPTTTSVPNWPATTPSASDKPIWLAGTSGRIDWVNTERHNLYLTNNDTAKGYIQAIAHDFYDSTLGTYKVVVNVYSSITNTVRTFTVDTARHPDIAIFDDWTDSIGITDTPNYHLAYVYEDLRGSSTEIKGRAYDVNNPFDDTKFALVPGSHSPVTITDNSGTPSSNAKYCPHIESSPNESPNHFPVPEIYPVAITWAESDGTVKVKYANHTDNITTKPAITVGFGENPDVARTIGNTYHYSYHVYYNSSSDKLICKKLDAVSGLGSVIDTFVLDSGIIVTAPPRIDAFNRLPGADDLEWIVVAEVQNGSNSEIREYRGGPCGIHMTNYSTIPVNNGTTIAVSNNPLYNNNGYSPCVAAGNGPDTYADPSSLGNKNYTLGWWIAGNQFNSLTIDHDGYLPASSGYARINTNNVNASIATSGQCKLALSNGNNDGVGIAAAWAADTPSGSTRVPMIVIKASNTLAFKPSQVNTMAESKDLLIYPNPTSDRLYIPTKLTQSYVISNVAGGVLARGTVNADGIEVRNLTPGVYFIRIQDERGQMTRGRFVKR